jgi:hypothetical protein
MFLDVGASCYSSFLLTRNLDVTIASSYRCRKNSMSGGAYNRG